MEKKQSDTFLSFLQEVLDQARHALIEKVKQSDLKFSEEETAELMERHFPQAHSSEMLVWNNLDEAIDHYLDNFYKAQLKAAPKQFKYIFYDFVRNRNRAGEGKLSDSKKMLMLFLGNYDVELTPDGVKVTYPRQRMP